MKSGGPVGVWSSARTRGLVGRFNETIVELVTASLKKQSGRVHQLWAVGSRVDALLAETKPGPVELFAAPTSVHAITQLVGRLLVGIESARERGEVTEVFVFHNHPKSGDAYEPVRRRLLPLDRTWLMRLAAKPWRRR